MRLSSLTSESSAFRRKGPMHMQFKIDEILQANDCRGQLWIVEPNRIRIRS
jgi:hypothetical protein